MTIAEVGYEARIWNLHKHVHAYMYAFARAHARTHTPAHARMYARTRTQFLIFYFVTSIFCIWNSVSNVHRLSVILSLMGTHLTECIFFFLFVLCPRRKMKATQLTLINFINVLLHMLSRVVSLCTASKFCIQTQTRRGRFIFYNFFYWAAAA